MKSRRVRRGLLACSPVLVVIAVLGVLVYGQILQVERDRALTAAIQRKDTPAAISALRHGASADARESGQGDPSLPGKLRQLWQHWFNPQKEVQTPSGSSALQLAVAADLDPVIRALLDRNAHDITARADWQQWKNIPLAAILLRARHVDLTWRLVQRGAVESKEDKDALLCAAAEVKNIEIARYLLDLGANPNNGNRDDYEIPILSAVQNDDMAMVSLLLQRGARADVDFMGIDSSLSIAAGNGNEAMVRALLAHGARVDRSMRMGTPLCFAVEKGHLAVAKLLLRAGAKADYDGYGGTVLMHATDNNLSKRVLMKTVELLLEHGADPNVDHKGYYVLSGAASAGDTALVDLLLKYGATVNCVDRDGATALSCAVMENRLDTARLLLRHGARQRYRFDESEWHGNGESAPRIKQVDVATLAKTAAMRRLLQQYR